GEVETSAFSSISAISTPTGTVSSTLTRIFVRRPARGDGSSAFILSVIISARDSSRSTQSPSFFSQLPIVPSATDSPKRGILTDVGIFDSFVNCNLYLRQRATIKAHPLHTTLAPTGGVFVEVDL